MILPAMGAISEIIPTFAKRTIFGYKAIAFSSLAIAGVGSLVWAHHMFTSGMSEFANMVFSLAHLPRGRPERHQGLQLDGHPLQGLHRLPAAPPVRADLHLPLLHRRPDGLMQGALAINVHIHDTYFIVGHFHYVMFGGTGFAFFAALLYWFPKMFGRMYIEEGGPTWPGSPSSSASTCSTSPCSSSACRACRAATTTTCRSSTRATSSPPSAPGSSRWGSCSSSATSSGASSRAARPRTIPGAA